MAQTTLDGVRMPLPSGVGWRWGVTANFVKVPQPLMGFYWNMPDDAECIFSEQKAKRSFDRGTTVHIRRVVAWNDSEVRDFAARLRAKHGSTTHNIARPKIWEDMYRYFDAVDLWFRGAWNMWRVIHLICDENEGSAARAQADAAVFNEIDDWVYNWCTHYENRMRLTTWDRRSDFLDVLSPADLDNVRTCGSEALSIVRGALRYWQREYRRPSPEEDAAQAARAVKLGYEDMAQGVELPAQAHDDNDISLSREAHPSVAPYSRPRRRSNSLPPPGIETAPAKASKFVYSANSAVVIANGTTPGKTQRSPHRLVSEPTRKGHHVSKSGPVAAIPAGLSLATRGAGVAGSGPSRLPSRSQEVPNVLLMRQIEERNQLKHAAATTASHDNTSSQPGPSSTSSQPAPDDDGFIGNGPGPQRWSRSHDCRNWSAHNNNMFTTYVACPCPRCTRRSRSVHVAPLSREAAAGRKQLRVTLTQYFSRWGYVEDVDPHATKVGTPYAFVEFASEDSALRAVAALNGQPIRGHRLAGARVTHPFFSKYYQPPHPNRPENNRTFSSAHGSQNSPHGGSQDSRRLRQQFNTPAQRHSRVTGTSHWSPASSSTMKGTPPRHWNRQMPGPHPNMLRSARSRSTMHPSPYHQPHQSPNGVPNGFSPPHYYGQGSFIGHYPPGNPPFGPPQLPPPATPYMPPQNTPFGSPSHGGWSGMPMLPGPMPPGHMPLGHMPPGPMPCCPHPPPGPVPHHPGVGFPPPGPHGFPMPPSQFTPYPPDGQGPQLQFFDDPSDEPSMQTRPSDEEAFDDQTSPTQGGASPNHSNGGNTNIRVCLPSTAPLEPGEPGESIVIVPDHSGVEMDSPVRRITFGDFASSGSTPPSADDEGAEPATSGSQDGAGEHQDGHSPAEAAEGAGHHPNEHDPSQQITNGYYHTSHDSASAALGESNSNQHNFDWQLTMPLNFQNSGDVRFDGDYNGGTVIRRRQWRPQPLPWMEDQRNHSSGSWNYANRAPYPAIPPQHMEDEAYWQPPNGMIPHQPYHQEDYKPIDGAYPQPPFAAPCPQPEPQQGSGDPGPSKPKGKKKKNKNKNRSALSSQTQSRASTPAPFAPASDAIREATAPAMPGPSNLTNGTATASGSKATTRPSTPAPAENQDGRVPWDDIYNSTPKKGKGKGRLYDPPPQAEDNNGQATTSQQNTVRDGAGPSNGQDAVNNSQETVDDTSTAAPAPKKGKGKGKASDMKPCDSGSGAGNASRPGSSHDHGHGHQGQA